MSRTFIDSGIDWIGKIPINWQVKPVKQVLLERKELNKPITVTAILSLTNNRGVIPYSEKGDIGNKSKEDISGYKIVRKGDIVINSMNLYIGSVGLSKYTGVVSPVYYMLYKRNPKDSIEYYNQLFQTKELQSKSHGYGNGILDIRMRIPMSNLNLLPLPVPPSEEQHRIVSILNKKVEQIDRLIKIQEHLIVKLKEYKQSIINTAVTKGVNANVPMKDSGIEWIGSIPTHWKLQKLKYSNPFRNEKNNDSTKKYIALENIESFSGRWIESDSQYDPEQAKVCKSGDILFGKLRPYLTKSFYILDDSCCSSEFLIMTNPKKTRYIYYLTLSAGFVDYVNSSTYGTKMPRANSSFIGTMVCPSLERSEEITIEEFLDEKTKEIDRLIDLFKTKIERITEYKKVIIYEYVTGKQEAI